MTELSTREQAPLAIPVATQDLLAAFADFLRLDVAQGDASPETVRVYWGQARAYLSWGNTAGVHPAAATEADLKGYRSSLVAAGSGASGHCSPRGGCSANPRCACGAPLLA